MDTRKLKICKRCNECLDLSNFYKLTIKKIDTACKKCRSILSKEKYIKFRNKLIAYSINYRKNNPNKVKETQKKSYLKNKRKIKLRNNTEKVKNSKKKWKKNNPELVAKDRANRRSLEKNAYPNWAKIKFNKEILSFYKDSFYLKNLTKTEFHVDHIIQLVHPLVCGLHVPWNLQIITAQENYDKNNKFNI